MISSPEPKPTTPRRDFLRWLLAVPLVACGASSAEPGSKSDGGEAHDGDGGPVDGASDAPVTLDGGPGSCDATLRDLEGPYYEDGAPVRSAQLAAPGEPGVRLLVEGRLLGPDCRPLVGYALDVWQADANGNYYRGVADGFRLRGRIVSDENGRYRFETILPGRYGDGAAIRPAHLHVKALSPNGGVLLTTQLYFAGDPYLGDADYCTKAGSCNSKDPARILALSDARIGAAAGKKTTFDAVVLRT
jgi:catechol 1,2-dioxygenase